LKASNPGVYSECKLPAQCARCPQACHELSSHAVFVFG
jgi:hypothetical protein